MKVLSPTLLLLGGVFLAGCGKQAANESSSGAERPTVAARLAPAVHQTVPRQHRLPGTVHPGEEAIVAARVMATVEETVFDLGQTVEEGEVLVRLEAAELDARLAQAEAHLRQVERNLERERSLLAQGATTAETVRTLEDEERLARARLEEARTLVAYTVVRAPYAGIVTVRHVRRGDLARPGSPLLELQSVGSLEVWVEVPDSLNQPVLGDQIEVEAGPERLLGELAEWSPAADPASRTRLAKLALPEAATARSGQYVEVLWPAGERASLTVTAAAVSTVGQITRVFVLEEGRARLRLIRPGATRGDTVEVLAGLRADEQVLVALEGTLRDGQPVEVRQ
ncbi:MAG: efflux RND transporter periplasmic adaptor subunit [Opitutales bacterium]